MIDARGLSCPEPVIMAKKAMTTKEDSYEMLVDNRTSAWCTDDACASEFKLFLWHLCSF